MLHAFLRGKLSREQEGAEDLLTSTTFGLLKYLPPEEGLLPFLARATSADGMERPLDWLSDRERTRNAVVGYEFWPNGRVGDRRCEPDVVLTIEIPGANRLRVLVEAKYRSAKSGVAKGEDDEEPADQLAREWRYLRSQSTAANDELHLVYLTAGFAPEKSAIEASINHAINDEAQSGEAAPIPPRIHSLLWRELEGVLEGYSSHNDRERLIAGDLRALMRRMNLTFFRGFTPIEDREPIVWSFRR